jgi:hypothetical protein
MQWHSLCSRLVYDTCHTYTRLLQASARELYRNVTTYQFLGDTQEWSSTYLGSVLDSMVTKVEAGVERASDLMNGLTPTYFAYEVTDFDYVLNEKGKRTKDANGRPFVKAKAFKVQKFPQFLEGYVRHFKVLKDEDSKRQLYHQVLLLLLANTAYTHCIHQLRVNRT